LIMKFCGIGFADLYFDSEVLWNRLCRTMLYFVSLLFVLLFGLLGFCTTHTIPIGGKTICISNQMQYFNKSYNTGAAASRVVQLIGKCPQILHCIVEDNLDPKFQLLVKKKHNASPSVEAFHIKSSNFGCWLRFSNWTPCWEFLQY